MWLDMVKCFCEQLFFFSWDGRAGVLTRRETEEAGKQRFLYSEVLEGPSVLIIRGGPGGSSRRECQTSGGAQGAWRGSREEGGPLGNCLYWGAGWSILAKVMHRFHGHVQFHSVTVLTKKGSCEHCCSGSSGRGAHSLLVGMLRQQDAMKL